MQKSEIFQLHNSAHREKRCFEKIWLTQLIKILVVHHQPKYAVFCPLQVTFNYAVKAKHAAALKVF